MSVYGKAASAILGGISDAEKTTRERRQEKERRELAQFQHAQMLAALTEQGYGIGEAPAEAPTFDGGQTDAQGKVAPITRTPSRYEQITPGKQGIYRDTTRTPEARRAKAEAEVARRQEERDRRTEERAIRLEQVRQQGRAPTAPVMGSPEWKAAEDYKASLSAKYRKPDAPKDPMGLPPAQANQVKIQQTALMNMHAAIKDLHDAVRAGGMALKSGAYRAKIEALQANAQIQFKEAANLGALSGPDMGLVESALGSATRPTQLLKGGADGVLASLSTAQQSLRRRAQTMEQVYGVKMPPEFYADEPPTSTGNVDLRTTGGMLERGNIDVSHRPRVKNPDGTISTVKSFSTEIDGREVLLPLVSDDGRMLTEAQAIDAYRRTGRHLGIFDSPTAATAYAKRLHDAQAAQLDGRGDGTVGAGRKVQARSGRTFTVPE